MYTQIKRKLEDAQLKCLFCHIQSPVPNIHTLMSNLCSEFIINQNNLTEEIIILRSHIFSAIGLICGVFYHIKLHKG